MRPPLPDPVAVAAAAPAGLRARLIRGVGWNLVATVFNQGSTLVLNVVLANLWDLRVFGRFAMVQSTITAVTAGAQAVVATTATRYAADLRTRDRARAERVLGLCALVAASLAVVAAAALVLGAEAVASRLLGDGTLGPALRLVGLVVLFSTVSAFLTGAVAGLEGYPALGRTGMAVGALYVAVGTVGGWFAGLLGAVAGLAIVAAVQSGLLAWVLVREAAAHHLRISVRGAATEVEVLRRFLAPSVINSVVAYSALWGANALLVRQPDGFAQMALFSAANSLRILVLFVPAIVNNVGLSLLSHQRGAGHAGGYARVFRANLTLTLALVIVGGATVAAAGRWLLTAFGPEFRSGDVVLWWLMIAAVPETAVAAAIQIAQSRERMWLWCIAVVVPCYGTLIGLAALLTPTLGARGLAVSYVGAMSVALVAAVAVVARLGLWADPPAAAES